jgi:hypothetical protein
MWVRRCVAAPFTAEDFPDDDDPFEETQEVEDKDREEDDNQMFADEDGGEEVVEEEEEGPVSSGSDSECSGRNGKKPGASQWANHPTPIPLLF